MKRALFHDDASPRLAIGLMSGTSADGIDAALVEISGCGTDTRVRLLSFLTLPFSDAARARILRVAAGDFGGTEELCLLNFYLGELSADACEAVCAQAGVAPDKVSFVGQPRPNRIPRAGRTGIPWPPGCGARFKPARRPLLRNGWAVRSSAISAFGTWLPAGLGLHWSPTRNTCFIGTRSAPWGCRISAAIGNITVLPKGCSLNDSICL